MSVMYVFLSNSSVMSVVYLMAVSITGAKIRGIRNKIWNYQTQITDKLYHLRLYRISDW
jgi:hypothetical protein